MTDILSIPTNKSSKKSTLGTRDGFGDALLDLGAIDNDIVVLCADLSESTRVHTFAQKFPSRFFQVGVAEQNLAGVSAGLALSGKTPFMTSYGVFSPGRNWDQIRTSICYSNVNVKIVSSHVGLSAGPDGATHQALEDMALARVLPNMTVITPCDYLEAKKATHAIAKSAGPVYMRVARESNTLLTSEKSNFTIGKINLLQEGSDVTLVSCGNILNKVMEAAHILKEAHGVSCEVLNCHTVKPLDVETLLMSVKKTKLVVVIEEHQIIGGLGSAVCECLSVHYPAKVKLMGINNTFAESGSYEELLLKYGLSVEHIVQRVIEE